MAKRRGSPEDTAAKNQARKATEQMLKRLAFYVTQTADGDLPKLLSSGFAVSSLPQKDDVPLPVTGITLIDGRQQGQMRLDFDKNQSAKLYEYQLCQIDAHGMPDEWSESYTTSSSRQNVVAPLTPYQRYGVRVRAVNGYGRSDWSEMVTHVVR
ncbi:fibronectin type III domain-containing protein [Sphingobacterium phlebotomi]